MTVGRPEPLRPPRASLASPPPDPLVSIVLCGYRGGELERCLESIYDQRHVASFEVVICDDASTDGAWAIANRYAEAFDGTVTLSRNRVPRGRHETRNKAVQLCTGRFRVELTEDQVFDAAYVGRTLDRLAEDKYLEHGYIVRSQAVSPFMPPRVPERRLRQPESASGPLASICVYNFNYGRYLRQCLDSAFAQTYERIEVCFSDNASTDDSWRIALEFAERHPAKMSLTRNRRNFGPAVNLRNCALDVQGKYALRLCSDDAIRSAFVERCVASLEQHPEAGFAMVHRDIMDEAGAITPEPSFYDRSCLIPGAEQAAVYMMSSVNPSVSQVLYNVEKQELKRMAGNLNDRWLGDRMMDFHIACDSPIVYLRDALLLNRVHGGGDGASMEANLLQCASEFVLVHQLADVAAGYGLEKPRARLSLAVAKLGGLCLRYCVRRLAGGDEIGAKRYFDLSTALSPDVAQSPAYADVSRYWDAEPAARPEVLAGLLAAANLVKRAGSYPPPPGSVPLDEGDAGEDAPVDATAKVA